ncbi:MAG TPA: sugar ABC transporter substrate-binding protein, partial [Nitrospirae bacterium]|nr:sugar ABC transporter substrate-binding protein [Nitrospirota bacterium]
GVFVLLLILLFVPVVVYGEDYIIGEGDTLFVSVWGNEALSLSAKVRPDGKITIPAQGEVSAAGLTPGELQDVLTEELKNLVKSPVVTVTVQEINNNKVYVFGGGVNPGVFPLEGRTTLLQLLCLIDGVNNADLRSAYIRRKGEKINENFYGLFIKGRTEEDLLIKANDLIFIPAYEDKNIYIIGAVNEPIAIEYREGLKVMEAILAAGGFTKYASKNSTVIYRKDGEKEISIPVKLKDLIKDGDLKQNVTLEPGDYVVVEEGMF